MARSTRAARRYDGGRRVNAEEAGHDTAVHCAECGQTLPPEARYCENCGYPSGSYELAERSSSHAVTAWFVAIVAVAGAIIAFAATKSPPVAASSPYTTTSNDAFTTSAILPASTTVNTFSPTPSEGTAATWTVTGADNQGYSSRLTIAFDLPVKASDAASTSVGRDLVSCVADPATDALIPVRLTITNTTTGFPSILGVRWTLGSASASALRFEGDVKYTDDSRCLGQDSDLYGAQWNDPIAPNAGVQDSFFLVVHNYFSPRNPGGDIAALDATNIAVVLTFGDTQGSDGRQSITVHATGTGAGPGVNIINS
jgi:hypothetical protein